MYTHKQYACFSSEMYKNASVLQGARFPILANSYVARNMLSLSRTRFFLYPFRFTIHYSFLFTVASVLPQMYFSAAYDNALPLLPSSVFSFWRQQPQFILSALLCLFALLFSQILIFTSFFPSLPFMFDTIPKSIPLTLVLSQHPPLQLPPPLLSYYFLRR